MHLLVRHHLPVYMKQAIYCLTNKSFWKGGILNSQYIVFAGKITWVANVIFLHVYMHVKNKKWQTTCRLKFWWKARTLRNLPAKRKKHETETETDKEKREKFQWTEEIVEYLLHSLKRYEVMCDFSGKDFDADKTFQYKKLQKQMAKKY